jgi:hypothetical protein
MELSIKEKEIEKYNNYNELNLQKIKNLKESNEKIVNDFNNLNTICEKNKLEYNINIDKLTKSNSELDSKLKD